MSAAKSEYTALEWSRAACCPLVVIVPSSTVRCLSVVWPPHHTFFLSGDMWSNYVLSKQTTCPTTYYYAVCLLLVFLAICWLMSPLSMSSVSFNRALNFHGHYVAGSRKLSQNSMLFCLLVVVSNRWVSNVSYTQCCHIFWSIACFSWCRGPSLHSLKSCGGPGQHVSEFKKCLCCHRALIFHR